MNLIDAHVTKVLGKRNIDANKEWNLSANDALYGRQYTIVTVEYVDMGGSGTTDLWFARDKEPNIEPGFIFQH